MVRVWGRVISAALFTCVLFGIVSTAHAAGVGVGTGNGQAETQFNSEIRMSGEVQAFCRNFSMDLIQKEYYSIVKNDRPGQTYKEISKDYKRYTALLEVIQRSLEQAGQKTADEFSTQHNQQVCTTTLQLEMPSWKYFACVLRVIKNTQEFLNCMEITCDVSQTAGKEAQLKYSIAFRPVDEIAQELDHGDGENYMELRLTYVYLNTVFNERGRYTSYRMPQIPAYLTNSIAFPLEGYSKLRKSWYASRDRGYRKHTGMDIHAPENTKILSCTAGTVMYVGWTDVAGYYVVVRDSQGYEFHYYHMVKKTGFLKPGDNVAMGELLGYVGNTGNSSVNHLHIGIISPKDMYINPYSLMMAAQKRDETPKVK